MKLKTHIVALSTAALVLASCSTADDFDFLQNQHHPESASKTAAVSIDFKVSKQLLQKFISINDEKPNKILPIVIDADTLAYQFVYTHGWKLISGDQRLSPVLAQSDGEPFNISDTNNPEVASIQGQLHFIQEIRQSNNHEKNAIWEFLSEKNTKKDASRKIKTRGIGTGMWIATDTTYSTSTSTHPHIIATSWHQDYPYNIFTPIVFNGEQNIWEHAPTGCVPIASGQVLYHYRKNNTRGIAIPVSATGPNLENKDRFIVNERSVNGWNNLDNTNFIAMFVRELGQKMGTSYSFSNSSTSAANMARVVRNDYLLDFDFNSKYDYSKLMSSLERKSPVIIVGKRGSTTSSHMFIIDGYREDITTLYIKYEWDESHQITEEEFNRFPQSVFEPDPKGDTERVEELTIGINTYITMNWGWSTPNSTWYIAHEYAASYESSDFAGSFVTPGRDYTYQPYWNTVAGIYNSVSHMYYNFREYYPEQ